MSAEMPVGGKTQHLDRLRRRLVWLPTTIIAILVLIEGFVTDYPAEGWSFHAVGLHLFMIALVTGLVYAFVKWAFTIINRDREEILRQERLVRALDRRFRALIENGSDVIILLSSAGLVGYVSPSATRLLGYDPQELIDRSLFDLIHADDRESARSLLLDVSQQTPGILTGAVRAQHQDGSWRWLGIVVNNLLADPNVEAIVCNARDITVRKHAEEALEERAHLAKMTAAIGLACTATTVLEINLSQCTELLVQHLDAALARVWTLEEALATLVLQASAGLSARVDGSFSRVPVGYGKIGVIARDRQAYTTNEIATDPAIRHKEWATAEGLVGFAGYPLLAGDRLVGVMAVFSRHPLTEAALQALGLIANEIGLHIQRQRAEEALQRAHDDLEQRVIERTGELAEANEALHGEVRERRRAQAELQSLFDGVPVGLYRTTPNGRILRSNRAVVQMLGCPNAETLMAMNARDLYVDPEARAQWTTRMERDGAVWDFEMELHRFDGRRIWVRHSARAVRGSDGKILHYDGVIENITKRKWADAALRESQARLQGIVESVMDGIVTIDADHQIASFNAAAETIFGCTAVIAVGQPVGHFIPEWERSDRPHVARTFEEIVGLSGRHALRKEVIALRADGEEFPCEVSISRVQSRGQRLYNAVVRDITELKRATRELEKSREMLRDLAAHLESVREKERCTIAQEIHDELGQALTGLKIDLAWLAPRLPTESAALGERVKDMLGLIDGTVQTVRRLATELRPGILDDLGLVPAIEWQAQDFQTRTEIQCEFTADADGSLTLDTDQSTAMFRILQEALTNVARHAGATRVNIVLRRDDARLTLCVQDNGRGITAAEIGNRRSLGLLGMRERTHVLGGQVSIAGRPGGGTTVEAWIPFARPPAVERDKIEGENGHADAGGGGK